MRKTYETIAILLVIVMLSIFLYSVESKIEVKNAYAENMAYAVIDYNSGVLLDKMNENVKMPIASTTKILTAITAIELNENINQKFVIPKKAVGVEGSSVYLKEGEEVSLKELLYGLMLRSGNDAATAIAIISRGSEKSFAEEMNKVAKNAGATNSNFVNPHGLQNDNHFSTAKDMCKITAYAMQNELFRQIVSSKSYIGERGEYYNKNKMLTMCDGANGVKTGYTINAGRCLVSSVDRNGKKLICVVLNCPEMYEFSMQKFDQAIEKNSFVKVANSGEIAKLKVGGFPKALLSVGLMESVVAPCPKGEENFLRAEINLPQNVPFPIKKGEIVGEIKVFFKKDLLFIKNIYTMNDVNLDKLIFG